MIGQGSGGLAESSLAAPVGTTHYVHDIFGNIITETAGGGATGASGTVREYVWLYETEIAPTMGSRTTVDRPLAVVSGVNTASPATWWVSVDHLNRPVKMTDSAKAAVWTAVWTPWGTPQSITGSATLNARFPGQWFQVEAGLHYNWHRHYDPTLGRYTQPDPLGFVDGPSVYGYVASNPVSYIDPEGQYRRSRDEQPRSQWPSAGSGGGSFSWPSRPSPGLTVPSPETAAEDICPPGDCSPEQHRDLQNRVENACGAARSCTIKDGPDELQRKIARHSECIDARRRINDACFRGGNKGHKDSISQRQRAIQRCLEFLGTAK